MEIAEDIFIASVVTLTPLFSRRKCTSVGDKQLELRTILSSILYQFEACAKIQSQAVCKLGPIQLEIQIDIKSLFMDGF